jgi:hypothetical protein
VKHINEKANMNPTKERKKERQKGRKNFTSTGLIICNKYGFFKRITIRNRVLGNFSIINYNKD